MSERMLVTGATGTVGREVIKQLTAEGLEARALVRSINTAYSISGPGVELVEGDYNRPDTLEEAFQGIDKAFLATPVDRRMGRWYYALSLAAKRAGTTHIAKLSAMGADPESSATLIRSHAETDQLLQNAGLKCTIIRPNSFFQNILQMEGSIRDNSVFHLPMGDAKQSHIDVRDVAAVAVEALVGDGHEQQIYDITGPESLSYPEMAKTMSEVLGRQIKYVDIPADIMKDTVVQAGSPDWKADLIVGACSLFAAGGFSEVTETVREVLGREPTDFKQFVQDHIDSFS